jgi:hypothetical protein
MSLLVFYRFDCFSVAILSIQANMLCDFTLAAVLNLIKYIYPFILECDVTYS